MTRTLTLQEILSLGVRTDEGCLRWPRTQNGLGYGRVMVKGKLWVVHRFVWTELNGPIPEGKTLDHVCHNEAVRAGTCDVPEGECLHRRCYEMDHLALKSQRDNWLDGKQGMPALNRAKTECHRGHPFDEQNTGRDSRGDRFCRQCATDRSRARYLSSRS